MSRRPPAVDAGHRVAEARDPAGLDDLLAEGCVFPCRRCTGRRAGRADGPRIGMLRWGPDDRLTEFTVMVRPFKGLTRLMELMLAELTAESDCL